MKKIFEVRSNYNDLTFINEFFTKEFCRKYKFFEYQLMPGSNEYVCVSKDHKSIKKKLLERYINCGRPVIHLENLKHNNTEIYLRHEFEGKPLDKEYAHGTIKMLYKITKRPVRLSTTVVTKSSNYGVPTYNKADVEYCYNGSKVQQSPSSLKYNI